MSNASIDRSDEVRKRLRCRPRTITYKIIAKETGLSLGFLAQFGRGVFKTSRGRNVECLAAYLEMQDGK